MHHPALTFRFAEREDVPAIVELLLDDPLGATREGSQDMACYYSAYEQLCEDLNNELIVVEAGGEIIGTLQLTIIPSLTRRGATRAQVEGVRVARSYRKAGIGSELMAWTIERAKARGCSLMQLTTDNERPEAHKFYERLGFTASHVGMKCEI